MCVIAEDYGQGCAPLEFRQATELGSREGMWQASAGLG